MNNINLAATSTSPKVILDIENNIFEISGESRPENGEKFYSPILQWLGEFEQVFSNRKDGSSPPEFNLNFEYFNSTSARYILDFCKHLSRIRSEGKELIINWHYEEEDLLEAGHEMSRISKFPFQFIEIKI